MKNLFTLFLFISANFQLHAQLSGDIVEYICNNDGTYDVIINVTGAQPNIFTDVFQGYDVSSQNSHQVTDCYDVNLVVMPCICTFLYAPVCGCDGTTYSNSCFAEECAGYQVLANGECDGSELIEFRVHNIPVNQGDVLTIESTYLNSANLTYTFETITLTIPFVNPCSAPAGCICPNVIDPNFICTAIYDPVCGCDGITYSNACVAQYYNGVTSWTPGECGNTSGSMVNAFCDDGDPNTINDRYNENCNCIGDPISSCACPDLIDQTMNCPAIYDPVCGCDGMTYSNECVAKYGNGIPYWKKGECGNTTGDNIFASCDDGDPNTENDRYDENCICVGDPISSCICPEAIDNNIICTTDFTPVCGCDGVTYSNACVAQYYNGVTSWTEGPCDNTDMDTIEAMCNDFNPFTNHDVYNDNCECCGVISSCVCPDLIDEDAVIPAYFDPVCGCNGIEYGNPEEAMANGLIKWSPGPCQDCYDNPLSLIWLDQVIQEVITDYCPAQDLEVLKAIHNNSPVIIINIVIGTDAGITYFFSCEGKMIQNCQTTIAGFNCDLDGGIDFGTLTTVSVLDVCSQSYTSPTSEIRQCDDGDDNTINDQYSDNCKCAGENICVDEVFPSIQLCEVDVANYNGPGGDPNGDGIFGWQGPKNWVEGTNTAIIDNGTCSYTQTIDIDIFYINEPCDDGNPNTVNDVIQSNCQCMGTDCSLVTDEDFGTIQLCETDLTSYPGPGGDPNGDGIIGWQGTTMWMEGINTATIDIGDCSYTQTVDISVIKINDPCDDGNPNTINDVIQSDCSCMGTDCSMITDENFGNIELCILELSNYSGPTGDPNGDGTTGWQGPMNWVEGINLISVTNSEGCLYTQQVTINIFNIGDPCDDNDPNTFNDVIQDDCECKGQIISSCVCPDIIDLTLACPAIYDPVCGCDGNTYSNSCVAQYFNGIPSWVPGECPTTTSMDTMYAECDDFNEFTSNDRLNEDCECEGFLSGCICPELIDPGRNCPTIFDPVCGCNGVTYSNSCFAEAAGVIQWTIGACDDCATNPLSYLWLQNTIDSLKAQYCPASTLEFRIANYNGATILILVADIGFDFSFTRIYNCQGGLLQRCDVTIGGEICPIDAGIDLSTVPSTLLFDVCNGSYTPSNAQNYMCTINGQSGYYNSSCECIPISNVTYIEREYFDVFPNPANDHIIVKTDLSGPVRIFNMTGAQILITEEYEIDVSTLNEGIYLIEIGNKKKRIVITR